MMNPTPADLRSEHRTEGEVIVTGTILESDGEMLKLKVAVSDRTAARWFEKEYEYVVDERIEQ